MYAELFIVFYGDLIVENCTFMLLRLQYDYVSIIMLL